MAPINLVRNSSNPRPWNGHDQCREPKAPLKPRPNTQETDHGSRVARCPGQTNHTKEPGNAFSRPAVPSHPATPGPATMPRVDRPEMTSLRRARRALREKPKNCRYRPRGPHTSPISPSRPKRGRIGETHQGRVRRKIVPPRGAGRRRAPTRNINTFRCFTPKLGSKPVNPDLFGWPGYQHALHSYFLFQHFNRSAILKLVGCFLGI